MKSFAERNCKGIEKELKSKHYQSKSLIQIKNKNNNKNYKNIIIKK
jgi:hypothetical protein